MLFRSPTQLQKGRDLRASLPAPVLLLASSREGEELDWARALNDCPGPYLPCVVPRHPQRFDEVASLMQSLGWQVLRRSAWPTDLAELALLCRQPRTLLLGDTLGEMPIYYAMARVALMGGSFGRYGGQNLIEALACACPVILGPYTYNFEQASLDALAAQAAARASDLDQGVAMAVQSCAQLEVTQAMAERGVDFLKAHRGVAERMALALRHKLTSIHR